MNHTTYLFGAGASYNALPLSNGFTKILNSFIEKLETNILNNIGTPDMPYPEEYRFPPKGNYMRKFAEAINWLNKIALENETIDVYAKKLTYRQTSESIIELDKLKNILTIFLLLEQAQKNIDKRYDEFIGSITENDYNEINIRNDVNILSWNYDSQFIRSFYGFCQNTKMIISNLIKSDKYIRINGYCDMLDENNFNLSIERFTINYLDQIMKLYNELEEGNQITNIKFAWENRTKEYYFNYKPQDLVIIGYSYPDFNREIDIKILKSIISNIKNIYVQIPESDFGSIKNRLEARLVRVRQESVNVPSNINIVNISSLDRFYLTNHI